ncbi:hypothetical protein O181_039179 [Austropuccinia psidii MF-1]|uniref:CBS domain-containing protein n=1 Tax=Austropuccinia psidii MF-1 TaxID=1389203 RepID=A0A9Q3HEA6_9BASI|nr:hypothetical protein [Austropuccinia psidii MF-1]
MGGQAIGMGCLRRSTHPAPTQDTPRSPSPELSPPPQHACTHLSLSLVLVLSCLMPVPVPVPVPAAAWPVLKLAAPVLNLKFPICFRLGFRSRASLDLFPQKIPIPPTFIDLKMTTNNSNHHLHCLLHLRQLLHDQICSRLPTNNLLPVLIDQSQSIKSALSSLLANGLISAPLFDDRSSTISGSFSLSDGLSIIYSLHPTNSPTNYPLISVSLAQVSSPSQNHSRSTNSDLAINNLLQISLSSLRHTRPTPSLTQSVHVHPEATLLEAGEQLCRSLTRRLPIIELDRTTGHETLRRVLTPRSLLHYLATHPHAQLDRLSTSIGSLRLGSYFSYQHFICSSSPLSHLKTSSPNQSSHHPISSTRLTCSSQNYPHPSSLDSQFNLIAATENSSLRELTRIFIETSTHAIPIIDHTGSMVDIYQIVDIIDLFISPKPPLKLFDLTVREAIALRSRKVSGITFCSQNDSLGSLLKYIAKNAVHLFVMVESQEVLDSNRPSRIGSRKLPKRTRVKDKLVGMLTLPEILDHLLSAPTGHHYCPPLDSISSQPIPLLSNNTSTYSSSLVSCSSNTSSTSFFSPTNKNTLSRYAHSLQSNTSNSSQHQHHQHSHSHSHHLHHLPSHHHHYLPRPQTPLSLPLSSYPSKMNPLSETHAYLSSNFLINQPSRSAGPSLPASCSSPHIVDRSNPDSHPKAISTTYQSSNSRSNLTIIKTPNQIPSTNVCVAPLPPMNKIAEFAAQMMCYLWFAEPSSLQRSSASLSQSTCLKSGTHSTSDFAQASLSLNITQAQLVPNPEFVIFIHNLLSTTQVSHSVVLLALFYIHRLKSLNPIKPSSKSEYRIGVVSLMLANKMLDDHTYTAKTWSEVSRLPLVSLNDGEIEFLQGLNFQLHVNIRDFRAWFRLLHGMVHLKDQHTALALASGPRTRWFKKMRVASGEGLSILEGLVSPIRNSSSMKAEAEEENKLARIRSVGSQNVVQTNLNCSQRALNSQVVTQQPSHPYNLRRSARGLMLLNSMQSTTTPNQTHLSHWNPSSSVSSSCLSNCSTLLPINSLSMTPQRQVELRQSQVASLPIKLRNMNKPHRINRTSATGKRNISQFLTSQEGHDDALGSSRKRLSSMNFSNTSSTSTVLVNTPITNNQPNSKQLPSLVLSQDNSASRASYLGTAMLPSQNNSHGAGPELQFRSLVAGRRGGVEQAVRQQVGTDGIYRFGSQPWRKGTPMEEGSAGKWFYSNFSNAGLPGVIWAEGTACQNKIYCLSQLPQASLSSAHTHQQCWPSSSSHTDHLNHFSRSSILQSTQSALTPSSLQANQQQPVNGF